MKYIIANWKSHKTPTEVTSWLREFDQEILTVLSKINSAELRVVVAPPFPYLGQVVEWAKQYDFIQVASQDISPFPSGKYTGAVAGQMLKSLEVDMSLVGHSERRRYFGESHQDVAAKVTQSLDVGLTPVICVDDEYIQLQADQIESGQLADCVVAYEELGAIGSGNNEPIDHVIEVVQSIREVFTDAPVLYGGSVSVSNVRTYLQACDGVLVGGASLQAHSFVELVRSWVVAKTV